MKKKNQIQPLPKRGYSFTGWSIFNRGILWNWVYRTRKEAIMDCENTTGESWNKCRKYFRIVKIICTVAEPKNK